MPHELGKEYGLAEAMERQRSGGPSYVFKRPLSFPGKSTIGRQGSERRQSLSSGKEICNGGWSGFAVAEMGCGAVLEEQARPPIPMELGVWDEGKEGIKNDTCWQDLLGGWQFEKDMGGKAFGERAGLYLANAVNGMIRDAY